MSIVLGRLQRGLERLYRISTSLHVADFIIDADARLRMGLARLPREQLLLAEDGEGLAIGLFVDDHALDNLTRHDPAERLHDGNFADFLLAVEGVSHFVYVVWRANADQPVSALELELQAEIDKYVTCLLISGGEEVISDVLRRRLFEDFEFEDDLDPTERERYQAANANAHRYSASLERRYVRRGRIDAMLHELRCFYRMSLRGKLEHIAQAA